ncbi:hypothetical protein Taro_007036 [Colocasia esculenta]|uniref:Uncharacterized protein n=1 Tax=Colocasia esculenta TaxID=4460 RepID=A0A843TZC0_COLES|nr:hypothetical protein [Colocasia esculenta]
MEREALAVAAASTPAQRKQAFFSSCLRLHLRLQLQQQPSSTDRVTQHQRRDQITSSRGRDCEHKRCC